MDWCKWGFHRWIDGKMQRTKRRAYGFAGCELPGLRLHQKCSCCPKERYMRLSLFMPASEMKNERIWKNV